MKLLTFFLIFTMTFYSCDNPQKKEQGSEPLKSSINSQEVFLKMTTPLLKESGKQYQKYKKVYARAALPGEEIITVTSDGVETNNTAAEGDYVVKNQTDAKEVYIMSSEKFNKRYTLLQPLENGFSEYQPIGKVIGIELTPSVLKGLNLTNEFEFVAPWGEEMVAKIGDFIVSPLEYDEVYRIAKKEFFETYELDPL